MRQVLDCSLAHPNYMGMIEAYQLVDGHDVLEVQFIDPPGGSVLAAFPDSDLGQWDLLGMGQAC